MTIRYLFVLIFALLISSFVFAVTHPAYGLQGIELNQNSEVTINDLVFGPEDLLNANASGLALSTEGISVESDSTSGTYTSQTIKAPNKFNAVVPQWIMDGAESGDLHLELRSGNDPSNLSQWIELHASPDWIRPQDKDIVGDMLAIPAADITHEYIQYRFSLSRSDEKHLPLLRELKFTFINSTSGPSVEEMIRLQEEINRNQSQELTAIANETDSYPKPDVISREVWCTLSGCDYTDGLEYEPVTHLILHHTVSGSSGDSAAIVRAIWSFHTSSRGWPDIGYNYLVDTNGVIFEGHLGGDDVIGIHASGANAGSMALAMIGTYSEVTPPIPMYESAVDLFSWKADQKNIDVLDASDTLPNIKWGLPNLMGHRDVYGTTECPGTTAHALLPALRDDVASRIGLESPYIYIDELSGQFQKSNANWYDGPFQCGYNAHSWYTWSTTSPEASANWGEWQLQIPENGRYRIDVYAPYCNTGASETEDAHYTVKHAQGTSSVIINQNDRIGLWTSLGEYNLETVGSSSVHLEDLTQTNGGRGVWFDAVRLLPLEVLPTATAESPSNDLWLNEHTVNFTWKIDNPEKAKATILQVATDSEFQNQIVNKIWGTQTYSTTVEFDQDYAALYWRVIVTSESNNEYPSNTIHFGIDTKPPSSTVTQLYWFERSNTFHVFWNGTDALVGVEKYNIDYRTMGTESWQRWLSDTQITDAAFFPPNPQAKYEFRSQAIDKLGNEEPTHSKADINTDDARVFDHALLLPMVSSS